MHRFDTFTDLRVNSGDRQGEITLWPSFTDIMTVVLMIFMLTMIVVIIKNTTLAQALLTSENQKKQVQSLLHDKEKAQAELKIILADLEEKLSQKQMILLLREDEISLLQQDLEGKMARIAAVEKESAELKSDIKGLQAGVAAAREEAAAFEKKSTELARQYEVRIAEIQAASEKRLAALSSDKAREIEDYNRKVPALLNQLKEKETVILALGGEKQNLEMSLAKQRQDFSALEEKYIRLIQPARSPAGKKVATVVYQRTGGNFRIGFKGIDTERIETLTMDQLHQQLGALRQKWQDQLYVKVIIPEDSGLTYNEAWTFTKDILSRYDYYFQEKAGAPEPQAGHTGPAEPSQ
jgi:DNA repair exonuclease SbcCD ATPase subunit